MGSFFGVKFFPININDLSVQRNCVSQIPDVSKIERGLHEILALFRKHNRSSGICDIFDLEKKDHCHIINLFQLGRWIFKSQKHAKRTIVKLWKKWFPVRLWTKEFVHHLEFYFQCNWNGKNVKDPIILEMKENSLFILSQKNMS